MYVITQVLIVNANTFSFKLRFFPIVFKMRYVFLKFSNNNLITKSNETFA
ncbi:MAG: hypothetical protein MAG581_00774 [Deltaproteobacteria bacterium]|jgi:hypothetical protein|nr:hypothetical protein [Deltaproteobacteria bacterium]